MLEIVTLGTGSAVPGLFRNHSSTALSHDGEITLFDCGEATQHQIQKVRLRHSKIRSIFISHVHGDHLFGLMGLLTTLSLNGRDIPLSLYGPEGLGEYVAFNLRFIRGDLLYPLHIQEFRGGEIFDLGPQAEVHVVELKHSIPTYGFLYQEKEKPGKFDVEAASRLKIPPGPLYGRLQRGEPIEWEGRTIRPEEVLGPPREGIAVGYALDTEPCKGTHYLAKNSQVLIHDATYKDEDKRHARRGKHSTHGEAISLALKHGVKQLILTHFSQRYLEFFQNESRDGLEIIYAYDGMRLVL
ncbi:MAG TPA: ribonuclease Z [Candidatus Mcinerneyibacteriales bacterium]|nr:ribonuclease Z [Candidatus Mcinerneyibacteriales bacterium]